MQATTLTLLSLVAYIAGLILLFRVAPLLVKRSFDDLLFIPVAAVAILGAMLAFGAVGITYSVFSGNIPIRVLDAFLLIVLLIVTIRMARQAFRPRYGIGIGTNRVSRIITGCFFIVLAIAAVYVLALLFVPTS